MPDPRFFEALGPVSLAELSEAAGAALSDSAAADRSIAAVAPLVRADTASVSFLGDKRYLADLQQTQAGACFLTAEQASVAPGGCVPLITPEPQAAYARAALLLHRPRRHAQGAPAVHPSAFVEEGANLGPGVVVGPDARIGAGTEIAANSVIGPGVMIGRDCQIGSNVTIGFALIGDRVRILSGAVIGEAGFGVAGSREGAVDVPQLGRVILQDGVTVGAGTCIDRGAWDDTVIGENTKIDNLVQIAHNVRIGRNCMIAAQVGMSGSVRVGDGAMFGGRAAIADHLEVGAGARIAASSGIMKNIPPGEVWCGTPAKPIREFMREVAWVSKNALARD